MRQLVQNTRALRVGDGGRETLRVGGYVGSGRSVGDKWAHREK